MAKAGQFEIIVSSSGSPIWCQIYYLGKPIARIDYRELDDLEYAVKKAIKESPETAQRYYDAYFTNFPPSIF